MKQEQEQEQKERRAGYGFRGKLGGGGEEGSS
jgi:hypothetical protein